jgi:anti-sigma regulatory factor (Ser/Thr protein kinase)
MYHEAELSSALEFVIDVSRQACKSNNGEVISRCVDFLETHRIDGESVQAFRLLISEALANALEHGILRLPADIKGDPLNSQFDAPGECADEAKTGLIIIKVKLLHENGNCEAIRAIGAEVSDSGPGFDWRSHLRDAKMPSPDKVFGRGLALIKMIASHLEFNEAGNTIQFVIACKSD